MILSDGGHDGSTRAEVARESLVRSRRLRDRFSPEDLQVMIDLCRSGTTAKQVAEKFGVSERSVKRLLHQRDIRRERVASRRTRLVVEVLDRSPGETQYDPARERVAGGATQGQLRGKERHACRKRLFPCR